MGACLAYNIGRYGTLNMAREKIDALLEQKFIERGETMMFSFGEIDVRAHVYKEAAKQNKTPEEIIDGILDNYLGFLKNLTKNYKVWVWGPSAAQPQQEGKEYVEYGSEEDRNRAILIFNDRLKERAEKIGIKHFAIARNLIDENFKTKTLYLADSIHLSQRAWQYAIPEFKKAGIDVKFKEKWWRRNVTPNKANSDEDLFRTALIVKGKIQNDFIKNIRAHLKVYDTDATILNAGNLVAPFEILRADAAYSFSKNPDISFEELLANNNVPVFFWRDEIAEINNPNLKQLSVNLTLNPSENENELTLSEIIERTGFAKSENLVLRLDAEGMEYDILWQISSEFLSRFKFINLKLNHMANTALSDKILFCLDKLNATHALVYVRAKEGVPVAFGEGKILPSELEATYILRKNYNFYKSKRFFPDVLDEGKNVLNLGYWG